MYTQCFDAAEMRLIARIWVNARASGCWHSPFTQGLAISPHHQLVSSKSRCATWKINSVTGLGKGQPRQTYWWICTDNSKTSHYVGVSMNFQMHVLHKRHQYHLRLIIGCWFCCLNGAVVAFWFQKWGVRSCVGGEVATEKHKKSHLDCIIIYLHVFFFS